MYVKIEKSLSVSLVVFSFECKCISQVKPVNSGRGAAEVACSSFALLSSPSSLARFKLPHLTGPPIVLGWSSCLQPHPACRIKVFFQISKLTGISPKESFSAHSWSFSRYSQRSSPWGYPVSSLILTLPTLPYPTLFSSHLHCKLQLCLTFHIVLNTEY